MICIKITNINNITNPINTNTNRPSLSGPSSTGDFLAGCGLAGVGFGFLRDGNPLAATLTGSMHGAQRHQEGKKNSSHILF